MNQITNEYEIITLESTDNSLISDINIKFTSLQYMCLLDRNILYFYNHVGEFQFKVDSRGDGPAQYNNISNVFYNNNNSTFYIHDMFKSKMLEYQLNGEYIREFNINDIGSITNLDENFYVVSYSPFANKSELIGILDHNFNITSEFIPTKFNNEDYTGKGFIMINDFIQGRFSLIRNQFIVK